MQALLVKSFFVCLFKDYQGHQLGPNDYSKHGSDQFKTQIDIGMSNNERSLITSYQNQFYFKNSDEVIDSVKNVSLIKIKKHIYFNF